MSSNYYVYQLRISDSLTPFYIGKGKGNRCFSHFDEKKVTNPLKTSIIRKAVDSGKTILVEKIVQHIDEDLAFLVEVECISKYGRISDGGCLTNLTQGGEGGNMIDTPLAREKWENSMREANNRPEVRIKRSESAKRMWRDSDFQEKMYSSRTLKYKTDPDTIVKKKFQAWNGSKDKWIHAQEIYQIWLDMGKCSYKRLENRVEEMGLPRFHLQKMVKYFIINSPLEDSIYQTWFKKTKENKNG